MKAEEQIRYIDSLYSMFLSNNLIHNALESSISSSDRLNDQAAIQQQMTYLLINSYLWQENYISTIYIFGKNTTYYTSSSSYDTDTLKHNSEILQSLPNTNPTLVIQSLEADPDTLYFSRNIYSTHTGKYIATIIININKTTWLNYFQDTTGSDWLVYLYNDKMELSTNQRQSGALPKLQDEIADAKHGQYTNEVTINEEPYLVAANTLSDWNITSCVAAPKAELYRNLNATLKSYLWVLMGILAAAVLFSITLSRMIVRPVQKMIYHINRITGQETTQLPLLEMFDEFNAIVVALNHMLAQLGAYYEDNLEKHMLLKNAEIHELQAQMDPHFLFNTLNTIAWKAQMVDDEEVYQMVISLGEMLKSNIYTRNETYVTLEEELKYVQFYTYLQKMRFEDKVTVILQADKELYRYRIPCFCIQPLVENAFVHGLEPKKEPGRLIINIISQADQMDISVIDDGVGFTTIPDIQKIHSSTTDTHTHIGLKNLDKRLFLLYGKDARLNIKSTPNVCTVVSFTIPLRTLQNESTPLRLEE